MEHVVCAALFTKILVTIIICLKMKEWSLIQWFDINYKEYFIVFLQVYNCFILSLNWSKSITKNVSYALKLKKKTYKYENLHLCFNEFMNGNENQNLFIIKQLIHTSKGIKIK